MQWPEPILGPWWIHPVTHYQLEAEAFRAALVEITEGYRFGRYPDSIRAAERILAQYPKR